MKEILKREKRGQTHWLSLEKSDIRPGVECTSKRNQRFFLNDGHEEGHRGFSFRKVGTVLLPEGGSGSKISHKGIRRAVVGYFYDPTGKNSKKRV